MVNEKAGKDYKLYICPKHRECIEDCDTCKEPHLLKDCMRPSKKDWKVTGCHVKCVELVKRCLNCKFCDVHYNKYPRYGCNYVNSKHYGHNHGKALDPVNDTCYLWEYQDNTENFKNKIKEQREKWINK